MRADFIIFALPLLQNSLPYADRHSGHHKHFKKTCVQFIRYVQKVTHKLFIYQNQMFLYINQVILLSHSDILKTTSGSKKFHTANTVKN